MIKPSNKEVLIKIQWVLSDGKWESVLLTADKNGHLKRPIRKDEDVDLEVIDERRCIGYIGDNGRNPCPDFKRIQSGQQCYTCREKDIHIDYVEGRSGEKRSGSHSVYLAQIGSQTKVGVTRSSRLMKRWIEQGAMYACELKRCGDADTALQIESEISDRGFKERIGKKQKSNSGSNNSVVLHESIDEIVDYNIENGVNEDEVSGIFDVQSNSVYPAESNRTRASRYGKISGSVLTVRGQLILTDSQCWAVTRGLCVDSPTQKSITDF